MNDPLGWLILAVAALALLVQLLIGGLRAAQKPLPMGFHLLLPMLLFAMGTVIAAWRLDQAISVMQQALDVPDLARTALAQTALAAGPAALGGALVPLLLLPVLAGGAWSTVRTGKVRVISLLFTGGAGLIAAALAALGAVLWREPLLLGVPALLLALQSFLGGIAMGGDRAGTSLALLLGAVGLSLWGEHLPYVPLATQPDAALPTLFAAIPHRLGLLRAVVFLASFGVAIGWITARPARRAGRELPALSLLLGMVLLGLPPWVLAHNNRTRLSAWGSAMVRTTSETAAALHTISVPGHGPLPARVLVAHPRNPHWIEQVFPSPAINLVTNGLDEAGRSLRTGDGLLLSSELTGGELYDLLAWTEIGELGLVGCTSLPPAPEADPLRLTGTCHTFPLSMRVTRSLELPRVYILLPGGQIDIGSEVVPLSALPLVDGQDVILRLQADATMADLEKMLAFLARASHVYLGWGVDLEGDPIRVGIDPWLRIRR